MFQDIEPHKFSCAFTPRPPADRDYAVIYNNDAVLLKRDKDGFALPTCADLNRLCPAGEKELQYLFSVDESAFFLFLPVIQRPAGYAFKSIQIFRKLEPAWLAFAGAVAVHLGRWYERRRFCGRCGTQSEHKADQRALFCPACGLVEYPAIAPVVIVAIVDGERLLLTRNAGGEYKRYALVAGYAEIGETLEAAVQREVMEEVGLQVKNICYYKSQPWPFSGSLLSGFFAELDGSDRIRLDRAELAEAAWFERKDLPAGEPGFSLTWDMIEAFRQGSLPLLNVLK